MELKEEIGESIHPERYQSYLDFYVDLCDEYEKQKIKEGAREETQSWRFSIPSIQHNKFYASKAYAYFFFLLPLSAWATESITVLCLGDSLTEGYGLALKLTQVYCKRNLSQGHRHVTVLDAGVSGATTASGIGRLRWALKAKKKPNVLLLALGANDGLRGQDVKNSHANLKNLIQYAKDKGLKVLLAGMKVPY